MAKTTLQPEENNWLKSMTSIRSSFCKHLHAKCYLNENEIRGSKEIVISVEKATIKEKQIAKPELKVKTDK